MFEKDSLLVSVRTFIFLSRSVTKAATVAGTETVSMLFWFKYFELTVQYIIHNVHKD